MLDFQAGYRAMQGVMGSRDSGQPKDFRSHPLRRWFQHNVLTPLGERRYSNYLEHKAGCRHCGELGCVEEGPCGGAMCMVHCHACGKDYYGDSSRSGISEYYGSKSSWFAGNRLASGAFIEPEGVI